MTTRRQILMRFGAVAGVAGAYQAMRAMGLGGGDEAWAGAPSLAPGSGKGVKVAILGAGVAGMSAAYEMIKAGYDCVVLEARARVGGRNWTMRKDAVLEMTDGTRQVCEFDEGHYFNAGPARIPSHHDATLSYCREFGVAMETEVNYSGTAFVQSDRLNGGERIPMRRAVYDQRGYMAELLAKCLNKGALDDAFTGEDKDKLVAGLGQWGGLAKDMTYQGTTRAGYATFPGAGAAVGTAYPPLPLSVVNDPFVLGTSGFQDVIEMQATMQQPVGGMDRIAMAFEARLGLAVKKGCEVKRIRRKGGKKAGVEIFYVDKTTGRPETLVADYCICTLPFSVLSDIPNDFSKDRQAAIKRNSVYGEGYKIAFQSPRFWETNDRVYGGLGFTERDTFLTWYPSYGFHQPEGVIVAGYNFNDKMGKRTLAEQATYARGTIDRLHPGQSDLMKAPIAIDWKKVPYNLGLEGNIAHEDPDGYTLMVQADGPFYFAGEHMSHVGAWQQGAIVSAHRVVNMIHERQASLNA